MAPEPGIEPGATGLEAVVLPLHHSGIVIGAPGEIRTHTVLDLNQLPPANWATGANVLELLRGLEPRTLGYKASALPVKLKEQILVPGDGLEPPT